jgi:hypothetical protein
MFFLGAINLNEHSSKFLTSLWLCLQEQGGANITGVDKKSMHNFVKQQHKKLVRDREPAMYFEVLPTPAELREKHEACFNSAYPQCMPVNASSHIETAVILLDGSYRCRGGSDLASAACSSLGTMSRTAASASDPMSQCLGMMMQLLGGLQQQPTNQYDPLPGLRTFDGADRREQSTAGRPMRSNQNFGGVQASYANIRRAASWAPFEEGGASPRHGDEHPALRDRDRGDASHIPERDAGHAPPAQDGKSVTPDRERSLNASTSLPDVDGDQADPFEGGPR